MTASRTSFSDDDGPHIVDVEAIGAGQAVSGNLMPVVEWQRYPKGFFARHCWES